MKSKNSVFFGILIGIIVPVVVFAMLFNIFSLLEKVGGASSLGLSENFRERTSAILAIAANLLPMSVFRRDRRDAPMRGVVVATGILAVIWVIYFGLKMM